MSEPISAEELNRLLQAKAPVTVIDVRFSPVGKIPGAVHVPVTDLEDKEWHWDNEGPIVVYCQYGRGASDYAAEVLEEQGYSRVRTLSGGLDAFVAYLDHPHD